MHKTFKAPFELKSDGQPGEFKAVFSKFNVIDFDGDVTLPGAFREQETAVEPWNHGRSLPAGRGVIKSNNKEAWIEGQFFLDTEAGKENYQTVKNMGNLAEWSYSFDILKDRLGKFQNRNVRFLEKLEVIGVGPVTRGAGIDTHTVTIKRSSDISRYRAQIDDLGYVGYSPSSGLNPRQARAELRRLAEGGSNPQEMGEKIGELLAGIQEEYLTARLKQSPGGVETRLERLRREMLSEGHTPEWIETVLLNEIYWLQAQLESADPNLGFHPGESYRRAMQIMSQPAG